MTKNGYNVGKDQADFDSLLAKSPKNRQWLYDKATKKGLNVGKDLGDFEHLMGWDNNQPQTEQTAQAGQQTAQSQVAQAQEQSAPDTASNPYHVDVQDFKPRVQFGQQQAQPRQDFTPAVSSSDTFKTDTTNAIAEGSERARSRTSYEMQRPDIESMSEEEKQKETEKAAAGKMLDIIEDKQNPINDEVRQFFPDYHYITERSDRFDAFLADYRAKNYNLDEIDQKLADINQQIASINKQVSDERNAEMGALGARYAYGYGNGYIPDAPGTEELKAARRALERAKKLGEEAKRYDQGDTYFLGNVGRGMKDKFWDDDTWDWGRSAMLDAKKAMQLKDKIDRGEEITDTERVLLNAMAQEAQAQMATDGKQTRGYKAGETTMFMLPFMLEMAANPTVAGTKAAAKELAIKATDRIARYAWYKAASRLGQGFAHYLTKGGVHLATAIPGGVAQAATTGIQRVEADYLKRRLGQVIPTVNQNGEVEFQGFDDSQVDSKAWAAYKALMQQGIENATEIMGAALPVGKALGALGRGATATAGRLGLRNTSRILAGLGENIAPLYNYIKNWPVANILEKGNWNGNIEEFMEEEIGMVLNQIMGVENTFTTDEGGMFNLDNQIDTLLGVGLFGTFVSTAATGSYAYNRHQARTKMAEAERLGTNLFGEEWVGNKKLIEDASPEELARILAIAKVGMTKAESDVLIRYATALQMERAVGLAELAKPQREPGQPQPLEEKTDESFSQGAEASTPEEIHAVAQGQQSAEQMLAEADPKILSILQQRLDAGASNTELQAVMEGLDSRTRTLAESYIASRAATDGVVAGAEQRAEQEGQRYSLAVGTNATEEEDGTSVITTGYYKDSPYYVRSTGGGMTILANAEGNTIEVPEEEVQNVTSSTLEELADRHTAEAMESERTKAEFYLKHNAKTQMDVQPGMVLQNGGTQFMVANVDGNEVSIVPAVYDAEQGRPVPQNNASANNISLEEAYALQDQYYDSIDNNNTLQAETDAQQPDVADTGAAGDSGMADTGTRTDGGVDGGQNQAEPAEAPAYPTDKNGKTDYSQIDNPEMMASAAQAEFGGDAVPFIDAEIAEAQAVIDNPKTANVERFRARKRISMLNDAKATLAPEAAQTAAEEPRYSINDEVQQQAQPTEEQETAQSRYERMTEEGKKKWEAMQKDIDTLAKALGVTIDYEEGLRQREGCNGKITGTHITLDPAFPEKSLEFLLGHELTHRMQDLTPEQYHEFKISVINVCPDFRERVDRITDLYLKSGFQVGNTRPANWNGRTISREQMDDEAIADYVGEMYQIENALDEFISAMRQPAIIRKLIEFFNWVTNNLSGLNTLPFEYAQTQLNRAFFNAAAVNAAEQTNAKAEKQAKKEENKNDVQKALEDAEKETETEPTEAQKEAGNYKKGHFSIDGYDVTIENPKGSIRRGTDASGKQWEQEMHNTYGYIRGTEGVDGDHIDVFFSEDPSQGEVFVIDQVNKDGSFDEHKVMYGFPDIESARQAYLSNYEEGWQGLGAITPVSKEEFKKWIDSSHRKTKPFAQYSSVEPLGEAQAASAKPSKAKDNKRRKKKNGKRYSIATSEEIRQMVDEEGLTEDEANELADKGLIMDGGAVMDMDSYDLKQETGYKTPNELTDLEEEETRYSLGTSKKWMEQFLGDNPTKRQKVIANAVMSWYDRAAADDAVNDIISKREYPGGDLNKDGKGPLRKNVEYVYTFDLDTTCPRTLQYLGYAQRIEKIISRPLSQKEAVILIETMRAYGQQIPCVYCYAENKRQALKQYFLDFIEYRNNVLNAATEEEARSNMYGQDSKGKLSSSAEKVLAKWRDSNVEMNSYRPTMKKLYSDYMEARDSLLVYLDYLKGKGEISEEMSDSEIVKRLLARYNIEPGKDASEDDKNIASSMGTIVNDWRYDELEGTKHKMLDEKHIYVWIASNGKKALALWNEMTKYAKSASGAHNSVKYYPYTNELLDIPAQDRDYINGMSGLRMHSSNDFRIDYLGDYLQLIADMDKGGWLGHTYTKNPMFVRIFGNTGYRINMSIAGYDVNGKVEENRDEGQSWDDVKELRKLFPNAGTMFMTTSSLQLDFALNADWVDMIIPFHNSGLPKAIWYDMRRWEDAQSKQNEKLYTSADMKAALKEAGVKIPKGATTSDIESLYDEHFKPKKIFDNTADMKAELKEAGVKIPPKSSYWDIKKLYVDTFGHECEAQGTRKTPHFLPYVTWVGGTPVPGHNNDAKRYLELCKEYSCKPRFQGTKVHDAEGNEMDITEHPGYIKVIKESARTDTPQMPVKFNLDEPSEALGVNQSTGKLWTPLEYAFNQLQEFAWAGGYTGYEKDDMGVINDFLENVIKWDEEHPDEPRQLDFISKEAREYWNTTLNITKSAAERAAMSEQEAQTAPTPYHPNPETGEMLETPRNEENGKKKTRHSLTPNQRKAIQMVNPMAEVESDNRYSISEKTNREYLDAVESGDMEKAKQMVMEAAKASGYEVYGLHGTRGEFTVFDKKRIGSATDEGWLGRGFYFWDSSNRRYAEQYANGGKVMEVLLRVEEPYLISQEEMDMLIEASDKHDVETLEEFTENLKENWYDSVVDTDGEILVFEPNQIKSADAVTYDDNGNVIPLSERFNESNEDIRYSLGGLLGADGTPELMDNLNLARDLEASGKDAKTIWRITGWERGKDGQWRFEIPDGKMKDFTRDTLHTVGDMIDAPELFDFYPRIKDYKIKLASMGNTLGEADTENETIKLNSRTAIGWNSKGEATWIDYPTLIHEIQHIIQDMEGFAKGGNKETGRASRFRELPSEEEKLAAFGLAFSNNSNKQLISAGKGYLASLLKEFINKKGNVKGIEMYKQALDALESVSDEDFPSFVKKAKKTYKSVSDEEAFDRYKRLAGETEARNASTRLGLLERERREVPPSATEDVPRDEQIVLYSLSSELDKQYPGWNEGSTKKNGGDNTQVTNTKSTYVGIGKWMLDTGQKDKSVLDASSGLGLGTQALRKMGINVDDVEPYATNERMESNPPTYSSYAEIGKEYDIVISNVVLNVIPDDWREGVVKDMAEHTKPGGKMIVAVRPESDAKTTKNKIELEDENELLVLWPDGSYRHYQKFWTQKELEDDMKQMLGDGWKVERATPRNSGLSNKRAVVCTRDGGSGQGLTPNQRRALAMVTGEDDGTRYSLSSASDFFATNYDEVGERFKNRNGTAIKRGGILKGELHPVGKIVDSKLYVHKDYANEHIKELEEKGKKYLPEGFEYKCLYFDPKTPDVIRYDEAPGFDKEREPFVGRYIKVDTKAGKIVDEGSSKAIWHGKWQWVGNDYKGFDVRESYEWQRKWASTLDEIAKGGSLAAWNAQLDKFGLPRDEAVNGAPDTRYSIAEDGTLVGVHNISEAKLNKAINMGGLVNPSLAVVDTDNGQHTEYGEISLIAPSELIDKKTGRNIGTFDRDAYTPMYPPVVYFPNKQSDANEEKLFNGLDKELAIRLHSGIHDYLEGNVTHSGLEYLFLKERHPELKPDDVQVARRTFTTMKEISDRFFDGKKPTYKAYEQFPEDKKTEFNLFIAGGGRITDSLRGILTSNNPLDKSLAKRMKEEASYGQFDGFIGMVEADERNVGKIDVKATIDAAIAKLRYDSALQSEFEDWQMMTIDNLGFDEKIQVGWKADGSRIYKKNTLENVSAYMKKQGRNASSQHWASGAGYLMAKVANNMKSLDSIRKNKGRLSKDADRIGGEVRKRIHDVLRLFMESGNRDLFSNEMNAFGYLEDIVVGGMSPEKVAEDFNKHTGMNLSLTDEQKNELIKLRDDIKDIPVRYFETKFERPVMLDEFAAAVVPSTITPRVEQGLKDAGLPIYKYDPETSGSREEVMQRAIDQEPNTRFSLAAATAPTFYSNAGHAVEQISQNKATPEQWEAMLRKNGGLKAEEDKWLGLTDWLHGQNGTVTKQQILDYINTNDIEIKDVNYDDEALFTPNSKAELESEIARRGDESIEDVLESWDNEFGTMLLSEYEEGTFTVDEDGKIVTDLPVVPPIDETRSGLTTRGLRHNREIALVVPSIEPYTTGNLPKIHFADEYTGGRAVAWIRFGETKDEAGNKVLVIDEVQSQRHQDARERGYKSEDNPRAAYDKALKEMNEYRRKMQDKYGLYFLTDDMTEDEQKEYRRLFNVLDNASNEKGNGLFYDVPDAPFRNNWQELAMKRMLRYAAENGYDKLAWTYGRQQAERYGLSKVVDSLVANRKGDKFHVSAFDKRDMPISSATKDYTKEEMVKTFGKDITERIIRGIEEEEAKDPRLNAPTYHMEGVDLDVGGKGMEGFYDRMLPQFIDKYCKRLGTKTQDITLPWVEASGRIMHSIDITPQMKDYVLTQGQPRYSIASGDLPQETIEAWDRLAKSQRFQLRETMFDYLTAVDKFQEFIAKENNGRVMDYQNAYMAMLALSSRNKAQMDVVDNMLVAPLNQIIKKITGAKARMFGKWDWESGELRRLDMYLKAKHGLERNRDMAVREALREKLERDIAVATSKYTDAKELKAEIEKINKAYRDRLNDWYDYLEQERSNGKEWLIMQHEMDKYAVQEFGADLSEDYAGLSGKDKETPGLFPDADDWMEAAYDYVFGYEAGHQQADIDELWYRIGAIAQFSLNKQNQSGLTSAEYVTEQTRRYQFYVPLRGWNADIAQDEYDYIDSRVGDFGNPIKSAKGRKSEAGNVMGALLNIAYRSISTGNKNLAMQKFFNLVSQFKTNGLAVINSRWLELVDGQWTEVEPTIPADATPEETAEILARFERDMEEKRKNGEAKRIRGKEKMAYKTIGRQKNEHQVRVYIGGEEKVITVTGDPRITQALNGLTNPSVADSDDYIEQKNSAIRNFMAGALTSKNMAFSIRNLARDTIHANNYAFCMENFEYWMRFTRNQNFMVGNVANMVKMMRLISGYNKAKTPETEDERLFKEFMDGGGATGYTYIQQQDELAEELADMLQKHDKSWVNPVDYVKRFFELTEFFGNAAELSNRFAAFKTSRQMGRSVSRSVSDAKEITLNFNRKGAGAQTKGNTPLVRKVASMTNLGRRFILFFNANMQGKYQLLRMLEKHPVKTVASRLVAPAVFMGMALPVINNVILPAVYQLLGMGSGDDGDEDNYFDSLTDHERSSYLCFRLPNKAGWLKIPLPPDITPMTEMGDLIGAAANGSRDLSGMDVTKCTVDMMSPVNINWGSGDNVNWTAFGLSFAPTALQPIGQAMTNTNYLGRNIYRKSFTSYDTDPEYRKTFRSTSPLLKELSRVANNLGGGTDYTTSDNIMDVNPALVQHFITSYLGGYGTTAVDITNALYSAYTGEDTSMTIQKVPVVSSFVVFGNKDVTKSRIESAYAEVNAIANKMKDKESNMKAGYKEAEDMGDVERAAKTMTEFNRMREGYDYKFYSLNKNVFKFIKKLDKSPETSVLQENLKYQLMKELTQMYHYRKPGRINAVQSERGYTVTIDTEDKKGNTISTPVAEVE